MSNKVNDNTAVQSNPQAASQSGSLTPAQAAFIAQGSSLPAPAGTNDNGEPYWIIDGQTISWAQMQQYLFQQAQAQQAQAKASGGGIEAIPQMPQMSQVPDQNFEAALEQSAENTVEKVQEKPDQQVEQGTVQPQAQAAKPQAKSNAKSYMGDSALLKSVDPSDPNSMHQFMDAHKDDSTNTSSHFLATMLRKVLMALSLEKNS